MKEILENRINEAYKTLEVFQHRLVDDMKKMEEYQQIIASYKAKNPSSDFTGVREELVTLTKTHYEYALINQSYQHWMIPIYEHVKTAEAAGIELDLSEDVAKAVEALLKETPYALEVKDGVVTYADNGAGKLLSKGLREELDDDTKLSRSYAGFDVRKV